MGQAVAGAARLGHEGPAGVREPAGLTVVCPGEEGVWAREKGALKEA